MSDNVAIGIDLGTTFSSVGVWQKDHVVIIANEQGNRITPSYVAFTSDERLVGDAAKNQALTNSPNTVFDAKRLIGRSFSDQDVQRDIKHWPFTVFDDNGLPKIEVQFRGGKKVLAPEEVGAMVLSKLKDIAEAYLGKTVNDAVIAVPAYFNDSQRQATKDAGIIAGLNVIGIINEPTAGALAYGLDKDFRGQRKILIYDLGGGTFDVSIVIINEGAHFEVKATGGDNHLGGEDFDSRLVSYLAKEYQQKSGTDLSRDKKALGRLRDAAERAKRLLSASVQATVDVDSLNFKTKVTRAKFEDLCMDLFKVTLDHVKKALSEAKMGREEIHEIVLVGGSTRIPKIQAMLSEFFGGKTLNHSINPDEAVAYGAAVRAAILSGNVESAQIENVVLEDVASLSLGIKLATGKMSKVIENNTRIPCKRVGEYITSQDYQEAISISVYEGEHEIAVENNLLGQFTLDGIRIATIGSEMYETIFELDEGGILKVTAIEKSTGLNSHIVIKDKIQLSKNEIKRMKAEEAIFKKDEKTKQEKLKSKNTLETYTYEIKQAIEEVKDKLSTSQVEEIKSRVDDTLQWLESDTLGEKEEYDDNLKSLKKNCPKVLSEYLDEK